MSKKSNIDIEPIRLSVSDKIRLWKRRMTENKFKSVRGATLPTAKQDFLRPYVKFPFTGDLEKEVSVLAFSDATLQEANHVCRENPHVESVPLKDCLEHRLFNPTKRKLQHSTFLGMEWNEKQRQ